MRALARCISVLGMRFRSGKSEKGGKGFIASICFNHRMVLAICFWLIMNVSVPYGLCTEMLDRIVAIVNDQIVLLSELQEAVERSKTSGSEATESQVLQELINRTLLIEQALKFRVEMETYSQSAEEERRLIDDYINRRIKAFINVPFEEIEKYYLAHRDDFAEKDIYMVWDKIENRLRGERLSEKLDEHISMLRKEASIRVQLNSE